MDQCCILDSRRALLRVASWHRLLNATFGNIVELILSIAALEKGLYTVSGCIFTGMLILSKAPGCNIMACFDMGEGAHLGAEQVGCDLHSSMLIGMTWVCLPCVAYCCRLLQPRWWAPSYPTSCWC